MGSKEWRLGVQQKQRFFENTGNSLISKHGYFGLLNYPIFRDTYTLGMSGFLVNKTIYATLEYLLI